MPRGFSHGDEAMLEKCGLSGGEKGKYVQRYAEGANVVVIDPDVAEYFPDHDAAETIRAALPGARPTIRCNPHSLPPRHP